MRKALGIGVLLMVVLCGASLAQAAWAPVRPVEIVAPAGPGGGWDLLARTMQKVLTEEKILSVPVLVTNKPGGGGATGWTYLKSKKGQGEFLAVTSALILQNNLLGKSDLTFKDFTNVANLQTEWEVVAVAGDAPWKTGKEFFEALKKDPSTMPIGVGPALGNNDHVQFLMLAKAYGVDPTKIKFVVYPNTAAEQIPAVMGGHIKAITISMAETLEQHKAGKIRLIGISSPERHPLLPDVATWKEQGIDHIFPHWRGLIAAPGITDDMKAFWNDAIAKMVASKTWKESLAKLGWDPYYLNAADDEAFLAKTNESSKELFKAVGLVK